MGNTIEQYQSEHFRSAEEFIHRVQTEVIPLFPTLLIKISNEYADELELFADLVNSTEPDFEYRQDLVDQNTELEYISVDQTLVILWIEGDQKDVIEEALNSANQISHDFSCLQAIQDKTSVNPARKFKSKYFEPQPEDEDLPLFYRVAQYIFT